MCGRELERVSILLFERGRLDVKILVSFDLIHVSAFGIYVSQIFLEALPFVWLQLCLVALVLASLIWIVVGNS